MAQQNQGSAGRDSQQNQGSGQQQPDPQSQGSRQGQQHQGPGQGSGQDQQNQQSQNRGQASRGGTGQQSNLTDDEDGATPSGQRGSQGSPNRGQQDDKR